MKDSRIGKMYKKIFLLCITLVIVALASFLVAELLEMRSLTKLVQDTGISKNAVVKEKSEETLFNMTKGNMEKLVIATAESLDNKLWSLVYCTEELNKEAEKILSHPESYAETEVEEPQYNELPEKVLQYRMPDSTLSYDSESMSTIRKLGNLEEKLDEYFNIGDREFMGFSIVLPNGMCLEMDELSNVKFDDDLNPLPYDPREEPWYKAAAENSEQAMVLSIYNEQYAVPYVGLSMPVYIDGELKAVVAGMMELYDTQEMVDIAATGKTGFSILIGTDNSLNFSSRAERFFIDSESDTGVLRGPWNEDIGELLEKTSDPESGFTSATIDGVDYYVAFARMEFVKGRVLMFIEKSEVEEPSDMLLKEMDAVTAETIDKYGAISMNVIRLLMLVAVLLLTATILAAHKLSKKLTVPINMMTERVHGLTGENFVFELEKAYKTGDEIEILAESFSELSDKMRQYMQELVHATEEKGRYKAELNVAAKIQSDMLPTLFPLFPDRTEFELYASMDAAKEVGGDFYDVFFVDKDRLCIVMADVSGKSVPAALFMVISKTMLKNRAVEGGSPSEILFDVNNALCEGNSECMFVTVWLAIVDLSTGEVREGNAGHEDPVLKRKGGEYELVEYRHGLALGVMSNMEYSDYGYRLEKGDCLFMYTDGVPEATNGEGKRFEISRMLHSLNEHKDETPEGLLKCLRQDVDTFVGGAEQFDDLTMLSIKYNGR